MIVGLVDVDGKSFPNLALMRISAFHKAKGDLVEWWQGNLFYYDKVYMSKIFSSAYSKETEEPINCREVIRGGTGYCIYLGSDGKEHFDKTRNIPLPEEVEHMFPDYSIYPQYDYAVSMTSIGCPRGCSFCHVAAKEGRCAVKVADVKDFWNPSIGKKTIKVLDPNITACKQKRELLKQYADTGCNIEFTQGIDIRLTTEEDIDQLNAMKLKNVHFAWDNPKDDLYKSFERFATKTTHKQHGRFGMVYVLVNYNSTMEENLYRIYALRDLNYDPYVMVYNKPNAPQDIKRLQRWCNNKIIFGKCRKFEDYMPT